MIAASRVPVVVRLVARFCRSAGRFGETWQRLVAVNFLPKPARALWPLILAILLKDEACGLLNVCGIIKAFVYDERVLTQAFPDSRSKARNVRRGIPLLDHNVKAVDF